MAYLRKLFRKKYILKLRMKIETSFWKFNSYINEKISNQTSTQGPLKILFASNIGSNLNVLGFDFVLARALSSRGHNVLVSLCNGGFAACMLAEYQKFPNVEDFIDKGMSNFCHTCKSEGLNATRKARLDYVAINPLPLRPNDRGDDESALAGAYRFLGVGQEIKLRKFPKIIDLFKIASKQYETAFQQLLKRENFDVVIAHHGIYVPQGNVAKLCQELKIPLVTWSQGYRKSSYVLSWGDTYHKALLQEQLPENELNEEQLETIQKYLNSRDAGTNDWIRYGRTQEVKSKKLEIKKNKKIFGLFTNVTWDARLHYSSNLFSDMYEWISRTVIWFSEHPEVTLIIRIHPAEVTGAIKSQDRVEDYLASLGSLPKNVILVGPEENISSYKIMDIVDVGLIYGTKAGIELATKGKPIVVVGESWVKNKGIAIEPTTADGYFEALEEISMNSLELPQNYRKRALRLAHYYFFERMIKVASVQPLSRYPYVRPRLKRDWEMSDPGLLSIVESIENKAPFRFENYPEGY